MGFFSNLLGKKETPIWAGWLYANESDISGLLLLGVRGPMVWRPDDGEITKAMGKDGIIERCLCDDNTLNVLVELLNPRSPLKLSEPYPKCNFSPYSYERAEEEWGWTGATSLI